MVRLEALVSLAILLPIVASSHNWPSGYNRLSRRTSWGRSDSGRSFSSSSSPSSSSPSSSSPSSSSRLSRQSSATSRRLSRQSYSPHSSKQSASFSSFSKQPSASSSLSFNSPSKPNWKRKVYPSYAERCGTCDGEAKMEVCGSDGKTYRNKCELENVSCRKYWDLKVVSWGPCQPSCPGTELGMYTGWGLSRASNQGYCTHDFFRCCKAARRAGLDDTTVRTCCQARADKCFAFVASKPWRSGITKYGK